MISSYEDKETAPKDKPKNKKKERTFKPPKKISEKYLYNSGLAYLQRFLSSSNNFRRVMMRKINKSCRHHLDQNKEDCEKMLENTVLKFQDLGLIDDHAYLTGMIVSLRRRGLSARQINAKLTQKGLEHHLIHDALRKHDTEEYETNDNGDIFAALIFIRKKRLGAFDTAKKIPMEKALATMARAGYSYDVAKKTLEIELEEAEEQLRRL